MDFSEMMQLEPDGTDTFISTGPPDEAGRIYGGQIVAQALRACGLTVAATFLPHSLHAYFVRPGDASAPLRFEVDRIRDGRSFVTRQVVARQPTEAILTMIASFQVDEEAVDVQTANMPTVDGPNSFEADSWTELFERRILPRGDEEGREQAWMRLAGDPTDDPLINACGIAYMSDDLPSEPVHALHPGWPPDPAGSGRFMSASLDHAVWFHRPAIAAEWHFEDVIAEGLSNGRGVSTGNLFDIDGRHIATIAQETLLRAPWSG